MDYTQFERQAARWLQQHEFTILATNFRQGRTQIDVIAQRGRTLILVEVKYRRVRAPLPEDLVSRGQQNRITARAGSLMVSYGCQEWDLWLLHFYGQKAQPLVYSLKC